MNARQYATQSAPPAFKPTKVTRKAARNFTLNVAPIISKPDYPFISLAPWLRETVTRVTLHIESEIDDVAVLHNILLTFQAGKAFFAGGLTRPASNEVVVPNDLSSDKPAFDVGVDLAGGLWCFCADGNGPRTNLFFAGGQERHQAEHVICGLDQFIDAGRF